MVTVPPTITVLEERPHLGGAQTRCRYLDVRIGDPAWGWRKPLVHVEPEDDRDRFLSAVGHWLRAASLHVTQALHVERDYALFEYEGEATLANTAIDPDRARAGIEAGLAALHAVGIAHGDLRPERVFVTATSVRLGLGIPWDERATPEADLRAARELLASGRLLAP
ncbi:MAG: hypothetical protein ABI867_39845 [Kofleriaceae bacterium]